MAAFKNKEPEMVRGLCKDGRGDETSNEWSRSFALMIVMSLARREFSTRLSLIKFITPIDHYMYGTAGL